MPAILAQGRTVIRDAIAAAVVSHVGISTASDAFADTQTVLDPTAGTNLIKTATKTNVDGNTFDATMTVTGASEFTNLTIRTIGVLNGALRTNALSRTVRALGIGVETGDVYTVGVRVRVQDNSA
jgi:hypothetical protein